MAGFQASILGMCRGVGKLFVLTRVKGLSSSSSTDIKAYDSDCKRLPISYVYAGSDNDGFDVAITLFDLDCKQRLVFSDNEGHKLELVIHATNAKIVSKVNSLLRKKLCESLRYADTRYAQSRDDGRCGFADLKLVPTPNNVLIRGSVYYPCGFGTPSIRAIDLRGRDCAVDVFSLDGPVNHIDSNSCGSIDALHFSILLSELKDNICLSAWNDRGDCLNSFEVVNDTMRQALWARAALDVHSATDQDDYRAWFYNRRATVAQIAAQKSARFELEPLFSIIVPLYKTPLNFFTEMADSVLSQSYEKWELILVNASPDDPMLGDLVSSYAQRDSRIKVIRLEKNLGITENTNAGVSVSRGDFICFFDHDDTIEPDILFEYVREINRFDGAVDLLYCDEDKLLPDGRLGNPAFKPDFSIDMLRDNNYICHMLTVRREAYDKVPPSGAELDGAQDHALTLKIAELGGNIRHISKVLYHWRISPNSTASNASSKPYATVAGIKAVEEHLARLGIDAHVEKSHGREFRYKVTYAVPEETSASIILPARNLENAYDAINRLIPATDFSSFSNAEFIVVVPELSSVDLGQIRSLESIPSLSVKFVEAAWKGIASAYNAGAAAAVGDVLVFCHDDISPLNCDWLSVLAGHACRPEVGVVGTMSLASDSTIIQAGLTYLNDSIINLSAGVHTDDPGYIFMPHTTRNVAAVDGACLAVGAKKFAVVSGFDDNYKSCCFDVDFCFGISSKGFSIVYTPEAPVVHYTNLATSAVFHRDWSWSCIEDRHLLLDKWSSRMRRPDPMYNINFSTKASEAARYRIDPIYRC